MAPDTIEAVISAIATYANSHESFVTKTKLLKLLYLLDLEYYKLHGETFTRFSWKFFHLGPWAPEYNGMLENLTDSGLLRATPFSGDFDGYFFKAATPTSPEQAFSNIKDDLMFRSVLRDWADCSTGQILDHVYFNTAPMANAARNEPLDFSLALDDSVVPYARSSSGATKKQIAEARARYRENQNKNAPQAQYLTPPNYDEEYYAAMDALERM